jgi:hypothetical protein
VASILTYFSVAMSAPYQTALRTGQVGERAEEGKQDGNIRYCTYFPDRFAFAVGKKGTTGHGIGNKRTMPHPARLF